MYAYLIYIKPRALIYGESVCVIRPITCLRVNFNVNNLYNRQNAVETIPPVPTPRTFRETELRTSSKTMNIYLIPTSRLILLAINIKP